MGRNLNGEVREVKDGVHNVLYVRYVAMKRDAGKTVDGRETLWRRRSLRLQTVAAYAVGAGIAQGALGWVNAGLDSAMLDWGFAAMWTGLALAVAGEYAAWRHRREAKAAHAGG